MLLSFERFALATCVITAFASIELTIPSQASANSCSPGERQLPFTGLCESEARQLLPEGDIGSPEIFGCEMKPNDTSRPGGAILYWAASCNGQVAEFSMSVSGSFAQMFQTKFSDGSSLDDPQVVAEYATDVVNPVQFALDTARWWMTDTANPPFTKEDVDRCSAHKGGERNGRVVYFIAYSDPNIASPGSPRWECGLYGLDQEAVKYWSLGQNDAWFIHPLSQDAMNQYDPDTITFIQKDAGGQWAKNASANNSLAASQQISDDYEVSNIAGVADIVEKAYDTTRDYEVFSGSLNGQFRYCVAKRDFDGTPLLIGFDGGQWQVAVKASEKPDYYSSYEVDGAIRGMSGTSDGVWTFWWLGLSELDQLRNGSQLIMNLGRASLDFDLKGTTAVILKVEECVIRKGGK